MPVHFVALSRAVTRLQISTLLPFSYGWGWFLNGSFVPLSSNRWITGEEHVAGRSEHPLPRIQNRTIGLPGSWPWRM